MKIIWLSDGSRHDTRKGKINTRWEDFFISESGCWFDRFFYSHDVSSGKDECVVLLKLYWLNKLELDKNNC